MASLVLRSPPADFVAPTFAGIQAARANPPPSSRRHGAWPLPMSGSIGGEVGCSDLSEVTVQRYRWFEFGSLQRGVCKMQPGEPICAESQDFYGRRRIDDAKFAHRRVVPPWRRHMDAEIRTKILTLLDQHRIMTIATLRPDGWPQRRPSATRTKVLLSTSSASGIARRRQIWRKMIGYR